MAADRDPRVQAEVRGLWQVTIIRISEFVEPQQSPMIWHVVTNKHDNAKQVLKVARTRFTPGWWDSYSVSDIVRLGDVHILDGEVLYEHD